MTEFYAVFDGPGGVRVEISDESKPYAYKNIYHVRLVVRGSFPDSDEKFERTLEKMGVFEEELEATRRGLVDSFRKTALPYLLRGGFSEKLKTAREIETSRKKGVGGYRH